MIHDAWLRHQQARWLRPDAYRWVRPDADRFLKPGTNPADVFPALDRKYSPNQLRIPAGRPDSGRWTDNEGGGVGFGVPSGAEASPDAGELSADASGSVLAFNNEDTSIEALTWPIADSETQQPIPNASSDDISDNLEEIGGGGRGGAPIEITLVRRLG